MPVLRALARAHDALTYAGATLSTVCLGAIVVFYCTEIVTRFFLNDPTSWTAAVSVYLMLATVMLMLPLLTMGSEHVAVSIAEDRFSPRMREASAIFVLLIAVVVCGAAGYFALQEAIRSFTRGVQTTDTLAIPKWWLTATLVYGLTSSTLYFLRRLIARIAQNGAAAPTDGDAAR